MTNDLKEDFQEKSDTEFDLGLRVRIGWTGIDGEYPKFRVYQRFGSEEETSFWD
jgi:hypothetical protein